MNENTEDYRKRIKGMSDSALLGEYPYMTKVLEGKKATVILTEKRIDALVEEMKDRGLEIPEK